MNDSENSASSIKRFAVIGNPVAHSRSPQIHAAFADQTDIRLQYGLLPAAIDQFENVVTRFFAEGGCGLNVTVPFKERAWEMAQSGLTERARIATAVNTLWLEGGQLYGCNTDGVGLLADIERLGFSIHGESILLIGAGGAAKGACAPLLRAGCERVHIVNRTAKRAADLHRHLAQALPECANRLSSGGLEQVAGQWPLVINATSSSISQQAPNIPGLAFTPGALAYDMFYANRNTAFMRFAQQAGAEHVADGLGMLVGQAATSFAIWHGVAPKIEPVLKQLREQLAFT